MNSHKVPHKVGKPAIPDKEMVQMVGVSPEHTQEWAMAGIPKGPVDSRLHFVPVSDVSAERSIPDADPRTACLSGDHRPNVLMEFPNDVKVCLHCQCLYMPRTK